MDAMQLGIEQLFIGKARAMPGDGRPTGIFKQAVTGVLHVSKEGLHGDVQADRRVHGGPEKALHQFAISNYAVLARAFPEISNQLMPGAMGENISTGLLDESAVCIGDVFSFGSAVIQLAQPRTPCWKIDARFATDGVTKMVAKQGIAGWYYRVLEEGRVQAGDLLVLTQRQPAALSVAQFNALAAAHRPAPSELDAAAERIGLTPAWRDKLRARAEYLRRNPDPG